MSTVLTLSAPADILAIITEAVNTTPSTVWLEQEGVSLYQALYNMTKELEVEK